MNKIFRLVLITFSVLVLSFFTVGLINSGISYADSSYLGENELPIVPITPPNNDNESNEGKPSDNNEENGCNSTLTSFSVLGVFAIAGASLIIKKNN